MATNSTPLPPGGADPEHIRNLLAAIKRRANEIAISIDKERLRADAALQPISLKVDQLSQVIDRILRDPELLRRAMADLDRLAQETRLAANLEKLLKERLRDGAKGVEFSWLHGGGATVRIDNREVRLSPKLAILLWALTRDEGEKSDDSLVGWKRKGRIAELMSGRSNLSVGEGALSNLVYRLRSSLMAIGFHDFVQTGTCGMRFALRRPEA